MFSTMSSIVDVHFVVVVLIQAQCPDPGDGICNYILLTLNMLELGGVRC